jgi:hypothetical protein
MNSLEDPYFWTSIMGVGAAWYWMMVARHWRDKCDKN